MCQPDHWLTTEIPNPATRRVFLFLQHMIVSKMPDNAPSRLWPCLRVEAKAGEPRCILDVSVSPNAKRTEVTGWHDGAIRIRLAAPPVDGAANDAMRKWLAKSLGLTQAQVTLLRGASGRRKQWAIEAAPTHLQGWLANQPALQKGAPDVENP